MVAWAAADRAISIRVHVKDKLGQVGLKYMVTQQVLILGWVDFDLEVQLIPRAKICMGICKSNKQDFEKHL